MKTLISLIALSSMLLAVPPATPQIEKTTGSVAIAVTA